MTGNSDSVTGLRSRTKDRLMEHPPMICFVAPSGTGKSTAIERLVGELTRRGLRVGVLKHDAHRLSYDAPGKDTWRFRKAGAWRAVIAGAHEVAVFASPEPTEPRELAATYMSGADLVLTEGYRTAGLPCIRVHRAAAPARADWVCPEGVVAWFTDEPVPDPVPQLGLADSTAQADFILAQLGLLEVG